MAKKKKHHLLVTLGIVLLIVAFFVGYETLIKNRDKDEADAPSNTSTQEAPPASEPSITYPVTYTNEQAASITLVVNKKHKLPQTYKPKDTGVYGGTLRQEAASALTQLFKAASAAGLRPALISGFRSYDRQQVIYNEYVANDGQAKADTYSARPGHSEHQTGLAADVSDGGDCSLQVCFGDTPLGKWLASNAKNYGFIIRYEKGKEKQTGYQYEPWHIRYVGVEEAKKITSSGKTMDSYYGVEAGDYVQ